MQFTAEEVIAEIKKQAPAMGVKPELVIPLFMAENSGSGNAKTGNGAAVSSAGARGVMQVMPGTARGLQKAGLLPEDWVHDPKNLSSQVQAGIAAIKDVQSRMKNPNDVFELAAGYNGSPAVHQAYLTGKPLPAETSDYLRKVQVASKNLGVNMDPQNNPSAYTAPGGTGQARTATTVRRSVNDPGAMENFTRSIMDIVQPQGQLQQTADSIIAGGQLRLDAHTAMANAIQAKAKATGEEAAAISLQTSTAALRKANILSAMNLNPDEVNNEMTRSAAVIDETQAQLETLGADIDRRMATTIFDNPFEWLVNQAVLPGLTEQYNGIARKQNLAIDNYKNKEYIARAQTSISTGMDADLIQRQGVAVQAKVAADAQEQLAKLQAENSAASTRDSLTMMQLATTGVQLQGQLLNQTKETETIREADNNKSAAAAADERQLAEVNKMIVAAGGTPLQGVGALKALPGKTREMLMGTATSGRFGKDFAESFEFVKDTGNINNIAAKGDAAIRAWYQGTLQKVGAELKTEEAKAAALGKKFDAKKEVYDRLNAVQMLYERQAATDMRTADTYNPYKLQYTNIAKHEDLRNNPLAIFINEYGPNGSKEIRFANVDEAYLMQRFAFSVSSGKMPMSDAVKAVTDFYKVGTRIQAMSTKWALFGMDQPTNTYQVQLPMQMGMGQAGVNSPAAAIDLGNPVQVENFLTKSVVMQIARQKLAEGGAPPVVDPLGLIKQPTNKLP